MWRDPICRLCRNHMRSRTISHERVEIVDETGSILLLTVPKGQLPLGLSEVMQE